MRETVIFCTFLSVELNRISFGSNRHYRIQYTECQSVYPFVGIGSPHPLHPQQVCLPLGPKKRGEEQHSLAGGALGGPNSDDWKEILTLCKMYILCVLVSLCTEQSKNWFFFSRKKIHPLHGIGLSYPI